MFSHESFQRQMCAVMEVLVEAAVAEMRRLLVLNKASRCSSCSALLSTSSMCGKSREEEKDVTLLEGTQEMTVESQFASLMETWTKGAVEKMALLLKVSMSRPAPKKRGGVKYKTPRKMVKQRAGTIDVDKKQSLVRGSCRKGKKKELEMEINRTRKYGNQGEGPDVTQEEDDDDAGSQPSTDKQELQATQPQVEETQEEVDSGPQPSTEKHELQATRLEPASDLSDEEDVMDTDLTSQELTANTEMSKKKIELIKCPRRSELNDEDVADLDTDLTCTTQELTANADKSKKKRKKKKKKEPTQKEPTQKEPIKKEPIKCPHQGCERTFALKCLFDRHFLYHSKPHSCSQCGKRFARPEGLVTHSRKHTGEKPFRCTECGTGFAYKSTFNRHMHQHKCKETKTKEFTCTFCEAEFLGKLAFQRHKCSALEKTFRCSLCAKTFECRQSLADHENLHPGERDFVCEMCGERFFSSSSLSTHRVTHIQQDHCCDELGLGCSDSRVLQSHLSKHTGEKLFTCDVCGKGCSHQSALNHHMLTHTGEKPYVCETCGKRCAHASALQNHLRIHTGQKPGQRPVCNVCGKVLSSMTKLKFHMSVHTGDKPYSCDQCAKQFRNPSNLNKHRMTHTGEKLYGCNICGRRFTAANSLRGHRLLHTGERPYRCPICGQKYHQLGEFKKHQKVHVPPQSDEV